MAQAVRPLAVVTGASTGIGYELAKCAIEDGHDVVIVANEQEINEAARALGTNAHPLMADLATKEGIDQLCATVERMNRPLDVLFANAGVGLGHGFIDQDIDDILRVINTNIVGTVCLVHRIAREMVDRGKGRIMITGSVAGYVPGTFQAVYNASKAFLDSFALALRHELEKTGVSVTCLIPGPTDTEFFERADLLDTKVGQSEKDDPADVAKAGYDATMQGESKVVTGWKAKMQVLGSKTMSADRMAEQHRKQAEPGSGLKH